MQTQLKDLIVDVEIIYKNNKNLYIRVKDNKLVVTCNKKTKNEFIESVIKANEKSLYKMYIKSNKSDNNDLFFNYLGKKYTIVYDGKSKTPFFDNDMIFVYDKKCLDKFYDKEVLRIFENELNRISPYFKDIPSFTWRVRKMKTRWGVNNVTKRIITLNTELLKKEIHLLDYVIIHELCHFYQANHSEKFWCCVANYYPDYKKARKELRGV